MTTPGKPPHPPGLFSDTVALGKMLRAYEEMQAAYMLLANDKAAVLRELDAAMARLREGITVLREARP